MQQPAIRRAPAQARDSRTLLDPLATKLLAGDFKPNDKIKVSAKDGDLVFQKRG